MRTVRRDDPAPVTVCDAMELERGSTWGDVVDEIAQDATGALDDQPDRWVRAAQQSRPRPPRW